MKKINLSHLNVLRYVDKKTLRNTGVLILVIGFFIGLCLVPAMKSRKRLSEKLTQLENNLIRSKKKINNAAALEQEKEKLEAFVGLYINKMIEESDKTRIMGDISDIAKQCDVTIVSVRPTSYEYAYPEDFLQYFVPLTYELKLESGYHEFGTFVNILENYDIIIKVEKFSIQPSPESKKQHDITLFVSTFAKA